MKSVTRIIMPLLTAVVYGMLSAPAHALLLDYEPAPATKPQQKNDAEQEEERLKKQLPEEKRENSQSDIDESSITESTHAPGIDMVSLPTGIKMGKYEVTQGQWRTVMGSNPSNFKTCGDDCPVEQVSWDDVQQFIQRLNSMTGKRYRLPSYKEWSIGCVAGSYVPGYCGSSLEAVAWYEVNSGATTHPVGQKQPNAYEIYDMSGNVREWISYCHNEDCVLRGAIGGSWGDKGKTLLINRITLVKPHASSSSIGFRLVQDP